MGEALVVFKAPMAHLVGEGLLELAQSPARHLALPPVVPDCAVRTKGYSAEHLQAVYAAIPNQACRDVVRLQVTLGMHHSEVQRVARGGDEAKLGGVGSWSNRRHGHFPAQTRLATHRQPRQARARSCPASTGARTRPEPGQHVTNSSRRPAAGPAVSTSGPVSAALLRDAWTTRELGYLTGQGVSLDELVSITGHRSSATTERLLRQPEGAADARPALPATAPPRPLGLGWPWMPFVSLTLL